ncbi:MAG TPA: SDR family NAD(P)-dependent oxidoreductase [Vicinamibacteria bacterium]|nr:SDR family NAD(P)-dependent oxidoreductase [Vicinamibacteria bacterium]
MDAGLSHRTFLITGAAGGIGAETARAFASEGASLVLHYHRNREGADALAKALPVRSALVQGDVASEADVDRIYAEALTLFPQLDGIVVNAGIWIAEEAPLHRMTLVQWQKTMDTDLTGAFLTCRGFLRHLADSPRDEASIVFVASTAALFGEENHTDYSSAKAAMAYGMTRSLKNEIVRLAPRGRVNCVCPGWVVTPMAAESMADPKAVDRVTATMSLRKIATPEDVAAAIVFLSSSRLAGHLSGTILPLAGGMEGRWLHRD